MSGLCGFIYCGKNVYKLSELPPSEKYKIAYNYYEKGKYIKAKELFETITSINIIENYADSAKYFLGQCYFHTREYVLAENEFQQLVNTRPGSMLIPKSKYMIGMCRLKMSQGPEHDQDNTIKAIQAFENFIFDPAAHFDEQLYNDAEKNLVSLHNRLAEKDLKNGLLYKKMGDYNAALKYFTDAVSTHNQYGYVSCIPQAFYEMGECHSKLKQYPEAKELYLTIVRNFSDDVYAEKAAGQLAKLKKMTTTKRDTAVVIKKLQY
jgi:outer membrane protein assembly factor BamD